MLPGLPQVASRKLRRSSCAVWASFGDIARRGIDAERRLTKILRDRLSRDLFAQRPATVNDRYSNTA